MDRRSVHSGKPPLPTTQGNNHQGIATLIVMVAVLMIIVLFCCFAAPGIRGLCKRYIFRTCAIDDPDIDNAGGVAEEAVPTIILLPCGRMLVVDHRALFQFRSAGSSVESGMELREINAGLIRSSQDHSTSSLPDYSGDISKDISQSSLGLPPPTYEEVFPDFPPSYSQLSFAKNGNRDDNNEDDGRSINNTEV